MAAWCGAHLVASLLLPTSLLYGKLYYSIERESPVTFFFINPHPPIPVLADGQSGRGRNSVTRGCLRDYGEKASE